MTHFFAPRTCSCRAVVIAMVCVGAFPVAGCTGAKYTRVRDSDPPPREAVMVVPAQVTAGNASNFAPDLSPNGRYVFYTSDESGNKDIVEKKASGGYATRLTTHSADDFAPAVSPDGKTLAFVSRREDAAGDIHILSLGFDLRRSWRGGEPNIQVVSARRTEDSHPAWYPNSDRIVFAARGTGDRYPQLMWADLDDLKPQPLGEARGDQPSVSPDGKMVAFVRDGSIMLLSTEDDKIRKLTEGGLVQDGQPRFSPDSSQVFFIRYQDDSNSDGRLDANDRPSIWSVQISDQTKAANLENFSIVPLTSPGVAAFMPEMRPPWLYFTQQTGDSLDIFRVPAEGQAVFPAERGVVEKLLVEVTSRNDRLMIMRSASALFARRGEIDLAGEFALRELRLMVDENRRIETAWLEAKIRKNFSANAELLSLTDLEVLRFSVLKLQWPENLQELRPADRETVEKTLAALEAMGSKSASSPRVESRRRLLTARMLATLRKFAEASRVAESVVTDFGSDREAAADAARFGALLAQVLVDRNVAVQGLQRVVEKFSDVPETLFAASNDAVRLTADNNPDALKDLAALRERTRGLRVLPARAHARIADLYVEDGKDAVAANELRLVATSYPESPEVTLDAVARLVVIDEEAERYSEAEQTLLTLQKTLESSAPLYRNRARQLLIDHWVRRGESLLKAREPGMAIKEYRKVIELDSLNINAHRGLIDAAFRRKALEPLLIDYEAGRDEHPNSAERQYFYGYARTYLIDAAPTAAEKIDRIDESIEIVERARELNAQVLHIQQTLGWLYLQRGFWTEKYRTEGGFGGKSSGKWAQVRGFFGVAEPNWLEIAIDAFLNAHYLSAPGSIERANLALNLGQTWYELGNFPKALRYYMERIRLLTLIPMRDVAAEALMMRRAGRAAFAAEDLALAEVLQRRALELYETLNSDPDIAQSLDALALTLRELKRFAEAAAVYERLLVTNRRIAGSKDAASDPSNVANTLVNLGYVSFMGNQFERALPWFREAEEELTAVGKGSGGGDAKEKSGAIQVDLGKQASAAKGFDQNALRLVVLSFRAQTFERLGRPDLAIVTLRERVQLMRELRKGLSDSDRKWIEDIAVADNLIADLELQIGDEVAAKSGFESAATTARSLRSKDQAWMTRDEWVNALNRDRVALRLAAAGRIDASETAALKARVAAITTEFRAAVDAGKTSESVPLVRYTALRSDLDALTEKKSAPAEVLDAVATFGGSRRSVASAALQMRQAGVAPANTSPGASLVRDFRSQMSPDSDAEWRYLKAGGDHAGAFEAIERFVAAGGRLPTSIDLAQLRELLDLNLLSSQDDARRQYVLVRRYLGLLNLEIARRIWGKTVPEAVTRALSLQADTDVANALGKEDRLIVAVRFPDVGSDSSEQGNTDWPGRLAVFCFAADQPEIRRVIVKDFSAIGESGDEPFLGCAGSGKRWYVTAVDGAGRNDLAEVRIRDRQLGRDIPLSLISAPDILVSHHAVRRLAKASVGYVSGPGGEAALTSVRAGNRGRDFTVLSSSPDMARVPEFQILHIDSEINLALGAPEAAAFRGGESNMDTRVGELTVRRLAQTKLGNTSLVVIGRVAADQGSIRHSNPGGLDVAVLSLAAVSAGLPSFVVANSVRDNGGGDSAAAAWSSFYGELTSASSSEAVAKSGLLAVNIGYAGIAAAEENEFAAASFRPAVDRAELEFDEENWSASGASYKEALYYARILGKDAEMPDLLTATVGVLFKARDFSGALHFQKQIAERAAHASLEGGDPLDEAEAVLNAAVLAVRGSEYAEAKILLDRCERIFEAESDMASLGKVWHYRGINAEGERQYDETIRAYEQSRKYYLEAGDDRMAAARLLDIGNVYKERLSNFPMALEYYDRARDDLKGPDEDPAKVSIQIDRANTLLASGEIKWAIGVLEKRVVPLIDRKKNLQLWIRANQILANAYFRAGQYQDAADANAVALAAAADVASPSEKAVLEIDARNLDAMIKAKLGDLPAALAEFSVATKIAEEFRLRSKSSMLFNNIGYWLREAGRAEESIAWFNRAIEIDTELKSASDVAFGQRNLGLSYILLGSFNRARELLETALKTSQELGLAYNLAWCHFGLGDIAMRESKWQDAEAAYRAALTISEKSFLQDFVWRAHAGIGLVRLRQDDVASAESSFRSAVGVIEALRAGLKSESSRSGFQADQGVQSVYADLVRVLMRQGKVEESWQISERSRARAFIDSLGNKEVQFSDPESTKLVDQERRAKSDLELAQRRLALSSAGGSIGSSGQASRESLEAAVARLRSEHEAILRQMSERNPQLTQFIVVDAISVGELDKLMPRGTAVVEYMLNTDEIYVWVIKDGKISGKAIPADQAKIAQKIEEFRLLLQNYSTTEFLGRELADTLLRPVEEMIRGAERLAIVPHSSLHYLAFAALPHDGKFLVDSFPIFYLESATVARFTLGARTETKRDPQGLRIVALGNPDVGKALALPFAEREARSMARYFPAMKKALLADATETFLLENATKADVIHIASHGEFNNAAPAESRLLLARDKTNDGSLTIGEIFAMRLNADLITLSACETGLGKLASGDEIIGMNRAFFYAGATSLVSSLWRISDVASAVVMKRFYRALSEGNDKAAALRSAQMLVREYYPHPAYWAAFRLLGDPL